MTVLVIMIIFCLYGFVLFIKALPNGEGVPLERDIRVSVIIPARNEEQNLPVLLASLMAQTYKPYEIIVVDDHSDDKTYEIAERYGVKVMKNPDLPENWTGKNWAVWNGYQKSSGDVLVFLDADVRLEECALEILLKTRKRSGGAISVVPYHHTVKFYEKLSLLPYLLGVFAFTSPFERHNRKKGLYGSCIVVTREDYEFINGHQSVRGELLDDINLGQRLIAAGINVENFIGYKLVSFRMYPYGIMSEIYGFGKGAVLSTAGLNAQTIFIIVLWLLGLLTASFATPVLFIIGHPQALLFLVAYIVYIVQIFYFLKFTGRYGIIIPVLNILSTVFFLTIMLYSVYRVVFVGSVSWKGREIRVRGRRNR